MWPSNKYKECKRCAGIFTRLTKVNNFCDLCFEKHCEENKVKKDKKHDFKSGDVVVLKSGGPSLTVFVSQFDEPSEIVEAYYFDEVSGQFNGGNFHHSLLEYYNRPRPSRQ